MFFNIVSKQKAKQAAAFTRQETGSERHNQTVEEREELRRQMYERIARGHAATEAEETAQHKWRGE